MRNPQTHANSSAVLCSFRLSHARRSAALIAIVASLWMCSGCGGPSELQSPEAHASADALYTAITSKKPELLSNVETRLKQLSADGKLSAVALTELNAIIATARADHWQEAAEAIDAFIRNQPQHAHSH